MARKNKEHRKYESIVTETGFKCQWCNNKLATCAAHLHSKQIWNKVVNNYQTEIHKVGNTTWVVDRELTDGYSNTINQVDMRKVGITCESEDGNACDQKIAKLYENEDNLYDYTLITLWKYLALGYFNAVNKEPTETCSPEDLGRCRRDVKRQLEGQGITGIDHFGEFHDWDEEFYVEGKKLVIMRPKRLRVPSPEGELQIELLVMGRYFGLSVITPCSNKIRAEIKEFISSYKNIREYLT